MKGRVLILDDDNAFLALLVDILDLRGFEVKSAGNGLDGLKCLDDGRFDVIISDIEMPVMDGRDFYRRLVEKDSSMKGRVIFVTTHMNDDTERFIKETGCRFLMKPFKIDVFLRLVGEIAQSELAHEFMEKRSEERIQVEVECLVMDDEFTAMPLAATTVDISPNSLGIRYCGTPLKVNDVVDIHLKELDEKRRMTVVWSSPIVGKMNGAGFKRVIGNA
ncbi:MAG: response regulator [Thermodesulfobacteriota bacterium]